MDIQTITLLAIIMIGSVILLGFYLSKQFKSSGKSEDTILLEWLKDMKGTVEKNTEVMERQLKDQRSSLEEQMKIKEKHLANKQNSFPKDLKNQATS